jgi:hypothetical protein
VIGTPFGRVATYVDGSEAGNVGAHAREEAIDKLLCSRKRFRVRKLGSTEAAS